MPHHNLHDIRVYCDEPADRDLFIQLATASSSIKYIPSSNITVYPNYKALGAAGVNILELVREDRPDFILTYQGHPFLVVELTEHGYTGDNPLQRFTRFATAAEERVPFVYFTPFARTRDDELDLTDDPSTLSLRRVNSNVFVGMVRLAEIFQVPMIALDWPVANNGKPKKPGVSPSVAKIQEIFGQLIEVLDLFVSELAPAASQKTAITEHHKIKLLQESVNQHATLSNIRESAVKFLLPGSELVDLICQPKILANKIGRDYFFADKSERLLALQCLLESNIEFVELPNGNITSASDPHKQLATVFADPRFSQRGYAFYSGYKWRSDPHCGVAVNTDYVYCRSNNARTPRERNTALVLFYPRISYSSNSPSYKTVQRNLLTLRDIGTPLYQLFEQRYQDDDPVARREKFSSSTRPIGIWAETTKQARIFRRYCDVIVLSDAILIGNHWKSQRSTN